MAKELTLKLPAKVLEILPNALFRVQLENENIILGHLAGKLRQHNINITVGDRVDIEISPYDLTKGRITYRHR